MKKVIKIKKSLTIHLILLTLMGLVWILSGCSDQCETTRRFIYHEPVTMSMDELRSAVTIVAPQPMEIPGKLYYKDGILFINEINKGIHLINNIDPSNPFKISFIEIPGNFDLAAQGNILYADSYVDLLAIDISDAANPKIVNRLEDVFNYYDILQVSSFAAEQEIVVDWKEVEDIEVVVSDCEDNQFTIMQRGNIDMIAFDNGIAASQSLENAALSIAPGGPGIGGSMARFTIADNYLYTVNDWQMVVFDIADLDNPKKATTLELGWGIETIFPYKDKLFLGARSGMHIYDNSNPESPIYISTYEHMNVCDPVVVREDIAYVTLRSGTECEGFTNQLDVIDFSDVTNPQLKYSYPMKNPHGLGIDGNNLFITEGQWGLKVFDVSDISTIDENILQHIKNIEAFDVIPLNNTLMVIGEDGFYQYDYQDPSNLIFLSHLSIQ